METYFNLSRSNNLNNFNVEEWQPGTVPNYTENSIPPEDPDRDDDHMDFDTLFGSQHSNDSNETQSPNIPMNTNHMYPEEEQSNSVYLTESYGGASDSFVGRYPNDFEKMYGECLWCPDQDAPGRFIRNERRNRCTRDASECVTERMQLFVGPPFECKSGNEKLYFHATDWQRALEIMRTYPKVIHKAGDLAANGAFYLNPDYLNCYQWLYVKNRVFQGQHAILIFKFDPWLLDSNGEELSLDEWKAVFQNRNKQNCKVPWSQAPQNSDPTNSHQQGKNPNYNRTDNGEIAMQLVIRSPQMCRQLPQYLVGCIFYEKIDSGSRASDAETSHDKKKRSRKEKSSSSRFASAGRNPKKSRRN